MNRCYLTNFTYKAIRSLLCVLLLATLASCKQVSRSVVREGTDKVVVHTTKRSVTKYTSRSLRKYLYRTCGKYQFAKPRQLKKVLQQKGVSKSTIDLLKKIPISKLLLDDIVAHDYPESILQRLAHDMPTSSRFAIAINDNPRLMHEYAKFNDAVPIPIRTDVNKLNWLSNLQIQSTKESNKKNLRKYQIENLHIDYQKGTLKYYDGATLLASERNQIFTVAETPSGINNLLNQNLMPNSIYIMPDGAQYHIDDLGRKKLAVYKPSTGTGRRDKTLQAIGRDEHGGLEDSGINAPYDDGGHLIPHEYGGRNELINLIPQNRNINRGIQKRIDDEAFKRSIASGEPIIKDFEYENISMPNRPTKITIKVGDWVAIIDNP